MGVRPLSNADQITDVQSVKSCMKRVVFRIFLILAMTEPTKLGGRAQPLEYSLQTKEGH